MHPIIPMQLTFQLPSCTLSQKDDDNGGSNGRSALLEGAEAYRRRIWPHGDTIAEESAGRTRLWPLLPYDRTLREGRRERTMECHRHGSARRLERSVRGLPGNGRLAGLHYLQRTHARLPRREGLAL